MWCFRHRSVQVAVYFSNICCSFPSGLALSPIPQDDAASTKPDAVSMAEPSSEDGRPVTGTWCATPVAVHDGASEASAELAAMGSDGKRPALVDFVVAGTVDGAADGERTEQDNQSDEEVEMAGEGPVEAVPDAVSDTIEAAINQLAPTGASVSGEGGEDGTLLSVGSVTLVHGFNNSASEADQMSDSEPVDVVGAAAAGEQTAGDGFSVTLDIVRDDVERVALEEETEPEQRVSACETLVQEVGAVVPATAIGAEGESSAVVSISVSTDWAGVAAEQAVEEVVSGDTAPGEACIASSEGDSTAAGPSESAEGMASGETQPPKLVVDELPEVEPSAAISDDPEAKAVSAK